MITINFSHKAVDDAFKRLASTPANALTLKIAGILADSTEEAFASETDPTTGIKWAPLSAAYAAWKQRHGYSAMILERSESDNLKTSIVTDSGADYALAGTNKVYGGTHQFGNPAKGIPARPYLGLDEVAVEEILEAVKNHYQNSLEGK